jgi:hypothetical protein
MADTAEFASVSGEPGDAPPPSPPVRRGFHGRGWRAPRWTLAIVLLVIAALLVPATIAARYARGELLNTDRFVATVAPLATDPAVQNALAERITDQVITHIDLPALINQATTAINLRGANALGNLVSGPLTDWLRSFIYKHVRKFVTSATFASLWATVTRLAHQGVNHLLTGSKGGAITATDGSIVLNIGPIVDAAKTALVNDGFALAAKVPSTDVSYTLFQSDQITKAQGYVRLLNRLATWLPWITLLIFALAVWLAPSRRRTAIATLVLTAALLIVELVTNGYIRNAYARALGVRGLDQLAGLSVYNQVIHYLITATVTTLVGTIVIIFWLWLVGPGRAGTALRRLTGAGFRWLAQALGWPRNRFWGGLYAYRAWVFLALGLLALFIVLHNPWVSTVVWLTIGALVIASIFAVVHRFRDPAPPGIAEPLPQ